ncbi:MAG: FtsK/SpoIIIE domain-containing protein [Acidimicrobiaceae bacterium]|nr:FtsK/SpoIIIE domain-containing protein [Acidimicrobiaceae bacterium]
MRVRFRLEGSEATLEIDSRLDGYTVADLAAALDRSAAETQQHRCMTAAEQSNHAGADRGGPGARAGDNGSGGDGSHQAEASSGGLGQGLCIDDCWYHPATLLSSAPIWEGTLLELAAGSGQPRSESSDAPDSARAGPRAVPSDAAVSRRASLVVTAGLQSGVRLEPPTSQEWLIGRSPECDLVLADFTVSRRHARITAGAGNRPTVTDLGSRNGTVLDGRSVTEATRIPAGATLRLGASCLQWRVEQADAPAGVRAGLGARAGRIPFNRPPRRRPPTTAAPLSVPAGPPAGPEPEPLSWAGIILPAVAGIALAVVWSPFMAVFAVLGPLITVATWLERRRRALRSHSQACAAVDREVQEFGAGLPRARAAERRRRIAVVPDPAELVRRAETPSQRCWERRIGDPDAMRLGVGVACVPYTPVLQVAGGAIAAPEALRAIEELEPLADVPLAVSLQPGEVLGVVGPLAAARAVARSLVLQAAVLHGPADLSIAGLAPDPDGEAEWSWLRWLPHTVDVAAEPGALVATVPAETAAAAEAAAASREGRVLLAVVDGVETLTGRAAAGRMLLGLAGCSGIVITSDMCDLPSSCRTIARVDDAGRLQLVDPRSSAVSGPVVAWGVTAATARHAAARLARLDDPELASATSSLPDSVSLLELLGAGLSAETVERRWADARGTDQLKTPLGAGGEGSLMLDLVADGPHLLIGGTTGSGKSELLRSLVAGLALSADPDHLAFVLIDYKGGAAFDRCAEMPHVAGMVTDLDDRLAERALLCLEAELRHREQRLRSVGAEDLTAFRSRSPGSGEPLPRLVVVVDEFATLAAELPEFLSSLVGIAQRGRSLGVHMVLATQRPAGVVTDDIRANTSCRIALRMTDRHDSNDVIDSGDAARIPRQRPGRAMARFGPGELIAFQSALATGSTRRDSTGLRVGPSAPAGSGADGAASGRVSDLDLIVEAVQQAHRAQGGAAPRSPWPAPLPDEIRSDHLVATAAPAAPAAWLVDDPARQRQFTGGWQPRDGHLVVIGAPVSGTTTTLATVVLDLCRTRSPDELHVYVVDLDSGRLSALEDLPHVGAVAEPPQSDRRTRLLRLLDDEISARRAAGSAEHAAEVVLVVDDLAGLTRAHDPVREPAPHDRLTRIWGDGPSVGVTTAVSVGRAGDLPAELAASAGVVVVHATSDASDAMRYGLKQSTADLAAGRAVLAGKNLEVQIARPAEGDLAAAVAAAAEQAPLTAAGPSPVGSLPQTISAADLPVGAAVDERRLRLRFAVSDLDLEPSGLTLHDGEHALVLGPARTGRTGALAAMGAAAAGAGVEVTVVGESSGELGALLGLEVVDPGALGGIIDDEDDGSARRLLLADDAERISDPAGLLAGVVSGAGRVHLVASTTAERLRGCYGTWLHEMRACRTGVLLRPGPLDADLLGASAPARLAAPAVPGRCLVVADGAAAVMQIAHLAPHDIRR